MLLRSFSVFENVSWMFAMLIEGVIQDICVSKILNLFLFLAMIGSEVGPTCFHLFSNISKKIIVMSAKLFIR